MLINSENIKNRGKAVILLLMTAFLCYSGRAQVLTDTLPHNKNAVIEEFTAVHCSYCPAGHRLLDSIMSENPGRVISIAMHPANAFSNYTTPYPGSQDFRRSYLNAFFTMPFVHDSIRFFPGAFINRRQWRPNKREQFTDKWRQYTTTILNEYSPVNIGLSEVYDASTGSLSVDVEIYYTDTVDYTCTLYLFLSEDSLVAEQNNGGVNYIHNHVFREALTQQWGDTIALQANKKTLVTKHYNFNNTTSLYDIPSCHLSALVRNAVNGEIITGKSINCDNIILSAGQKSSEDFGFSIFPNPAFEILEIEIFTDVKPIECYCVEILDFTGRRVLFLEKIIGDGKTILDVSKLYKGTYMIALKRKDRLLGSKKFVKL
jgi:hypothetical protein